MTQRKLSANGADSKALLAGEDDFMRGIIRTVLQEVLEAEMSETWGPSPANVLRPVWATGPAITPAP